MAADDAAGRLGAAVGRLAAAAVRRETAAAAALGLRRTDLLALEHIAARDGVTPGELARELLLSSGGVSAVADRLVEGGHVVRCPGESARRRVLLRAVERGRAAGATSRRGAEGELAEVAAALDSYQRALVERTVLRMAEATERHAAALEAAERARAADDGAPIVVSWG